jgi:hypothetical protein
LARVSLPPLTPLTGETPSRALLCALPLAEIEWRNLSSELLLSMRGRSVLIRVLWTENGDRRRAGEPALADFFVPLFT